MTKNTSKLENIAYFFHSKPSDTLAHHRISGPCNHLGLNVIPGYRNESFDTDVVEQGDIVVIQRDFPRYIFAYEQVTKLAREQNIPVIMDLDDLLLELPETHPDRIGFTYADALLPMYRALTEVDMVTVSSKPLGEYIQQITNNVEVLPNYFDDHVWSFKEPDRAGSSSQKIVIGYMGGESHAPDLKILTPVFKELAKHHHDRLRLSIWGIQPPQEFSEFIEVEYFPLQIFNYQNFAAYFQTVSADLFVAPLANNIFNSCKSSIKFFEYSALGVPGVYSRFPPYSSIIENGENGLLASTTEEWIECISSLLADSDLRTSMALNAQETVRAKWLLSNNAHTWLNAYQNAIKKYSKGNHEPNVAKPPFVVLRSIDAQLDEYTSALRSNVSMVENSLEQLNEEYSDLKTLIDDKQQQVQATAKEKEILEKQVDDLQDEAQVQTGKAVQLQREIQDIQAEFKKQESRIEEIQTESRAQTEKINSLIKEGIERSRAMDSLTKTADERGEQIIGLENEIQLITGSNAWRFAMIFRRIRYILFPPDTLRLKAAKKLITYALIPYKYLYVIRDTFSIWRKSGATAAWRHARDFSIIKLLGHSKEFEIEAVSSVEDTAGNNGAIAPTEAQVTHHPTASVVIPVYDRTDLLIGSIESILNQTFQDFEIILVCDGSPQETLEIVNHYSENNPKVRAYYFKNNSGNAIRGRNKGIKEARGKYLAFQDSDDIAEPERLATSIDAIEGYDADVVYGGWRAIVDGTRLDIDVVNNQEIFSPDCDYALLKKICVPCQSTVMARVEALRSVGGLNDRMKYREDHELWLRMAYNGYTFKSINRILTNLLLHDENLEISLKKDDAYWEAQVQKNYLKPRTMKPKIGYVIPGTGIGGGIIVICEHANRLLERGFDVTLISEDNHSEILWYPNLLAEVIPLKDAQDNYDILVATGWPTAYTVANLHAYKKFYLVQSDERRFYPIEEEATKLAENTYKMDFEFLTIAKWLREWLSKEFGKDAIYVPNGLNREIVHQDVPISPKSDRVRVLLEGPINIPFKGMQDAFMVIEPLDCEVWCVSSSGKPRDGWRCDRFFEKIPWTEMRRIYSSCDILLKMSRVESFAYPPLEMMACGGTSVISRVTGIEEYVVDEYNALVVEPGDLDAAREAVKRLIEDNELRHTLIRNGEETAKRFDWEPSIDILEETFYMKPVQEPET